MGYHQNESKTQENLLHDHFEKEEEHINLKEKTLGVAMKMERQQLHHSHMGAIAKMQRRILKRLGMFNKYPKPHQGPAEKARRVRQMKKVAA